MTGTANLLKTDAPEFTGCTVRYHPTVPDRHGQWSYQPVCAIYAKHWEDLSVGLVRRGCNVEPGENHRTAQSQFRNSREGQANPYLRDKEVYADCIKLVLRNSHGSRPNRTVLCGRCKLVAVCTCNTSFLRS